MLLGIAGSFLDYDFLDNLASNIPKRVKAVGGTGG